MKRNALIKMVQFSILLALEVIMCFTPLGSIPIGPYGSNIGYDSCYPYRYFTWCEPAQLWDFCRII